MTYAHTDVGTDPHMYIHQRVRTERRTLRRYNWRDSVDSRHNQKVRGCFFFQTHTQVLTHHHPHSVAKP